MISVRLLFSSSAKVMTKAVKNSLWFTGQLALTLGKIVGSFICFLTLITWALYSKRHDCDDD